MKLVSTSKLIDPHKEPRRSSLLLGFLLSVPNVLVGSNATNPSEQSSPLPPNHPWKMSLDAEALLLKVTENGLSYGISNTLDNHLITNGKINNIHIPWQWGFRIGCGERISHGNWDLFLYWTHFHGDSRNTAKTTLPGAVFPTWTNPQFSENSYAESAKARWRLHLGIVDLELGRQSNITSWFTCRPFIGLRSAWIRQKFLLDYYGGTLVPFDQDKLHMKNKFWGIGPLGGLGLSFVIGKGFSIVGQGSLSLPYGWFYTHQSEDALADRSELLQVHSFYHQTTWIEDLSLGIQWMSHRETDRFKVRLKASWETHIYQDQNQLPQFLSAAESGSHFSNHGDLAIQGFAFAARLDF